MTKDIKTLLQESKKCFDSCSDYSCVRRDDCTGAAGHAVTDYHYEQEHKQKADQKYREFKALMDRYTAEKNAS